MSDIFSKKRRSEVMSRIRGKNTGIERVVFRRLRKAGIRFKKHYGKLPGTPDVVMADGKTAVFIDGDFWHGYRYPAWRRKIKGKFWRDKIERNRARDRRIHARLRRLGWTVIRVWEHQLRKDEDAAIAMIIRKSEKR